jgi:TatD DNase family protein
VSRLVDTHCHLDDRKYHEDREDVIARALDTLEWMVAIGINSETIADTLAVTRDRIYAGIGYHPYYAKDFDDAAAEKLAEQTRHPSVVALGEMGLDYFHEYSPRDAQKRCFERQLRMAVELRLPVIIHNREADADSYAILKEFAPELPGCVMHCFGSGPEFAEQCLALGFHISFAGNVTYPKAQILRDAAMVVPLDRMLVETDAPYLSPQPVRSKRCEPSSVVLTAEALAQLRGVDFNEFAAQTTANAHRFFNVPVL